MTSAAVALVREVFPQDRARVRLTGGGRFVSLLLMTPGAVLSFGSRFSGRSHEGEVRARARIRT